MANLTLPKPCRRSEMWRVIRTLKGKSFTRNDLRLILEWAHKDEIDGKYLNLLVKHGFLTIVEQERPTRYQFIKDNGIDAPRFTNEGVLMVNSTVNENVWRSMRILKTFTVNELVANSGTSKKSVSHGTVIAYVRLLRNAGYLIVVEKLKNKVERLKLIKDTGRKPPQILRVKEVYDPNINKIVYREVPDAE